MSKYQDLFDNESDVEEDLKINEDYASRYDKWRSKEEYEKIKARAATLRPSSDDSSEGEDDDKDFGKPDNPDFDREFLRALGAIYKPKKDANVKDEKFFEGDYRLEKEKEEKPMTVMDYERRVLMEHGGQFDDNEVDTRNSEYIAKSAKKVKLDDGLDDDDDDGDDLLTSGLFKVKEKPSKVNEVHDEAVAFVKGESSTLKDAKDQDLLKNVKKKWNSKKLPKEDKWLLDFFLNKRYLKNESDDESEGSDTFLDEEEMAEENDPSTSDPLAPEYKFRHQEPGDLIKRHPRSVPDSFRPKDERRKARREATKQRQLEKKEQKRREIEILKAMKYKEIEEKIAKIKEVSGNTDLDLGKMDLEADFDPAAHDAHMEQLLGEDYYDECNAELVIPDFIEEDDDVKVYDNWAKSSNEEAKFEEGEGEENHEDFDYGEDINMDADYEPEESVEERPQKSSVRRKGRRQSRFAKALEKKKPLFDPSDKDFSSYLDEYYKLDFEDVVGGIPCRFNYRKVESNNFGLTTGEILAAQNSDLNRWIGIKKILRYDRSRELEAEERHLYQERAKHAHIKKKFLPSLFEENPKELAEKEQEKRRLKNLKRKQVWRLKEGLADDHLESKAGELNDGNLVPKKKKAKHKDKNDLKEHVLETEMQSTCQDDKPKKKKKRKELMEDERSESVNEGDGEDSSLKKKKKKKKHREHTEDTDNTLTRSASPIYKDDEQSVPVNKVNTEEGTSDQFGIDNEGLVVKKKKSKKKHKDRDGDANNTQITNSVHTNDDPNAGKNMNVEDNVNHIGIDNKDLAVKKKKKKKRHDSQIEDTVSTIVESPVNHEDDDEAQEVLSKQKNKKKHLEQNGDVENNFLKKEKKRKKKDFHKHKKAMPYFKGISDARLEAYGQNPKKLKNRVIYGKEFCS